MINKRNQKGITLAKLILIIFLIIFILPFIVSVLETNDNDDTTIAKAKGFTIESYYVELNVKEDNNVNVTEEIVTKWYEKNHHGIYKFTPEWLKYTGKDGKTIKRKSKVSNLKALGEEYSIDWVNKKARIKIGSADTYVPIGFKPYTITYTYDMGKDPYKNFDEFIFHVYGDYWGTEIKNASIKINMPKSIEGYNIKFFADKYREEEVTKYVDYYVTENTIYANFNNEKYYNEQGKKLTKSLTVDIELPEGYFSGGSYNYGWGSFIICLAIIGLTIFMAKTWYKYGKNHPKKETTLEFYPPENLSSAEIGYIYGKQTSKKLTISLIISLAAKGYIKIDEIIKDKKKQIQITRTIDEEPRKPRNVVKQLPKREIAIRRIKKEDKNLSKDAQTMMKYLFRSGNKIQLKANINKFLKVREELVNGGYINITNDNEQEINTAAEYEQERYNQKMQEYKEKMKEYSEKNSSLPELNKYEKIVFKRLFDKEDSIILSEHQTLYKAFDEVNSELEKKVKDKIKDKEARKKRTKAIFITIVTFMLYILAYRAIEDMSPSYNFLYRISAICIFVNIFLTIAMGRRTEYGEEIKSKINGFRDFLITAEKPKLEELVSDDPQYFYNILPYTYILNVSKRWIKKFEDIPIPQIDMGNFNYDSDMAWNSFYSDIHRPVSTYSSSGRGCSSCGGGCSSCGGGCSSCGGGGSW